jgi:hypothetical protein
VIVIRRVVEIWLLALTVGCGDAAGPENVVVASVELSAATVTVGPGNTSVLTAVPRTSSGAAIRGRAIAWTSSVPGVAAVNAQGHVTGVSLGAAIVRAEVDGKYAEAAVAVVPTAAGHLASQWRMASFDGLVVPAVYATFYDEPVGDVIIGVVEIRLDSAKKVMSGDGKYQRRYYFTELHDGLVALRYFWGDHGQFELGQTVPVPLTLTSDYIEHLTTSGRVAIDGRLELSESLWIGEMPRATIWLRVETTAGYLGGAIIARRDKTIVQFTTPQGTVGHSIDSLRP